MLAVCLVGPFLDPGMKTGRRRGPDNDHDDTQNVAAQHYIVVTDLLERLLVAKPLILTMNEPPAILGDEVYVNIIDKLRECGIADQVSLPQLVVVGDQSSGKSSVLESLTGFAFPRAAGLCTRYATQITSRRDGSEGIDVSIIPHPNSSESRAEQLRGFRRSINTEDLALAEVFADQQHLTIIDVPGIFRTSTENLTTDNDILLVRNMVKKYITDQRTIILAVIPCNVDIATQEVLTMAKEVDPDGVRTLGVLTKPDLAPEKAMQQAICDLIQGRKNPLRLGYYVVKNRGSDDIGSCHKTAQQKSEQVFFSTPPWADLQSTRRVGTTALLTALRDLLRSVTKQEFKNVALDVKNNLANREARLERLGPARDGSNAQRRCLTQISTAFQSIAQRGRQGLYNGVELFANDQSLKLISHLVKLNEAFSKQCNDIGHTLEFQDQDVATVEAYKRADKGSSDEELSDKESSDEESEVRDSPMMDMFQGPFKELREILQEKLPVAPTSTRVTLMEQIARIYDSSRGPELGTSGGSALAEAFRHQSQKWEPLALRYTSQAIRIVHHFIVELLKVVCPDESMRGHLMSMVLQQKLCNSYKRAMKHTQFILDIERNGPPYTLNHYFNENLHKCRTARLAASIRTHSVLQSSWDERGGQIRMVAIDPSQLSQITTHKSNSLQVHEDIHDILKSYYKVARKRFVDVVCQQSILYYLLDVGDGPLNIFTPELVSELDDKKLNAVAGEDFLTRNHRDQLVREVDNYKKAAAVLEFGG
ncbi:interferon-induced GTP-binding protein Mx1 [Verticillium alfalfae VaMs.102]|uniref:Interferon-induced GTP-binding protein Mx1 n=1 Tax=Verticillium alfalfae (strain VaMs.102 / ATCC MYA-4576 / FGSC 10136) TaxID=526221 RepID=C9S845_VERA1|nr:interferon-induced GTP-binding protein Mx1 [Verticillium alfalfae VaMs.102]EEY14891.1 interferon-induced GTP-binding protein Mx1 [Verticillium alfalfae VaMs.102]